jgi:hypothetical protein
MGISDPLLTYAGIPLCAGVAVFALGHLFASQFLRSLGLLAFAFGVLVLVVVAVALR